MIKSLSYIRKINISVNTYFIYLYPILYILIPILYIFSVLVLHLFICFEELNKFHKFEL